MAIKITIEKDSKAAQAAKEFIRQKDEFRNAVKSGKVNEYAKDNEDKLAQPVRRNAAKRDLSI